ncbi:MAG: four-helix bundle copper-binding protein [Pseudonocardiales bacterium]|nr:four-helix bundle copper-binding protein [Pseudonocardiales bacterium]
MVRCIRLDLDCADVCTATGRVLSRQTAYDAALTRAVLEACATACRTCGDECAAHGERGMEHCRVCAEACRRCEQACRALLSAAG